MSPLVPLWLHRRLRFIRLLQVRRDCYSLLCQERVPVVQRCSTQRFRRLFWSWESRENLHWNNQAKKGDAQPKSTKPTPHSPGRCLCPPAHSSLPPARPAARHSPTTCPLPAPASPATPQPCLTRPPGTQNRPSPALPHLASDTGHQLASTQTSLPHTDTPTQITLTITRTASSRPPSARLLGHPAQPCANPGDPSLPAPPPPPHPLPLSQSSTPSWTTTLHNIPITLDL